MANFRAYLSLSALLLVYVASFASAACKGGIPQEEIGKILAAHNKLRAAVSAGTYVAKGAALPQPKTPLRALEWDCDLAQRAQSWAAHCSVENSKWARVGENTFMTEEKDGKLSFTGLGDEAAAAWENELQTNGLKEVHLTPELWKTETAHATQMLWANTSKIGCGMAACAAGRRAVVVCQYKAPGNELGKDVYETKN